MAASTNPKLNSVNRILRALGYSVVSSIETSDPDVVSALDALNDASREVQVKPLWFNQTKITLIPNTNSEIELPQNTTSVQALHRANQPYASGRFIQRGARLYDTDNNTYTITENVDVVLISELEFNDLPYTAQNYITARAITEVTYDTDKSTQDFSVYSRREQKALQELKTENINTSNSNMLMSPERTMNNMTSRLGGSFR